MKRCLPSLIAKNKYKAQLSLILVILLSAYLYLNNSVGKRQDQTRSVKWIRVGKDGPTDTSVAYQSNVKLTYYRPNPKYKITEFEFITPKCYGEACELNNDRVPVAVTPVRHSQCIPISKCVTVNIKTRHRYQEVKEFIDSIHQYYPVLKIVVLDEFNPDATKSEWVKSALASPLITYIQAKPGVGYGRKLAAMVSDTPYVLVVDDDYMFFEKSNVTKLANILENSDADIAAGTTDDSFPFAGAVRVSTEDGKNLLSLYPGVYYNVIPNYKNCYQADIVKTFFLAKRDSILKAGSWDVNRPFYEHEDFFFQMRKGRVKIAYCDDVIVKHVARTRDLANLRKNYFDEMKIKLVEKWRIEDYFSCTVPMSYNELDTCPLEKRKHFH